MQLVRNAAQAAANEDGLLFFPQECETIAVNRVEIASREHTQMAIHDDEEEIYIITQGTGNVFLNDVRYPVQTGDVVYVPRNTTHWVENVGSIALIYLCVANWPDKNK
ncbi:cupin domain-containing protein [Oscillospiraceae bacterium LTW-04]|nr:cupin domain-containing protein [Oscillospiraceae bacterium MB24-C1]